MLQTMLQELAAHRGTKVHHMCEDFLNNNFDDEVHKKNFLPYVLFGQIKPVLMQKVNNIFAQECGLYSDKYKVAGRVDCIAEYNGIPSIVDFKTSTKERNDDWNESYYIQASAYAEMFEERTGNEINQIVILVVTEDGVVQEFVKTKNDYLPLLVETIDDFTEHWEREENEVVHNNNNDTAGNSVGQPETPLYIPFMEFADREQCMTFARNNQLRLFNKSIQAYDSESFTYKNQLY